MLLQVYVFHVENHPDFPDYVQCVTYHSFPSPYWERVYITLGMVMTYIFPLFVIVVTYSIILLTIKKKSKNAAHGERQIQGVSQGFNAAAGRCWGHQAQSENSIFYQS